MADDQNETTRESLHKAARISELHDDPLQATRIQRKDHRRARLPC
jgi:hypothetical protein